MDLSTAKSAENDIDDCPPTPENLPTGEAAKTPPPSTALLSPNKPSLSEARKKRRSSDGRTSPEETTCAICLGQLDNRSYTDTCFHKFCFTCLLEWSKVKAECPLCKGKFTSIIHNIRSDEDYDTYEVPQREPQPEIVYHDFLHSMRRFRYHTTQTADRLNRRRQDLAAQVAALNDNMVLPSVPYNLSSRQIYRRRRGPGTSEFRRDIYTRNLWVQPLSDFTGRFRECSGEWYEQNEATTHRLVPWLNRELNVLLEGTRYQAQNPTVLNLITEWIKRYDIQSPEMRDRLLPYLGTRTEHFQHEFFHFARSPFDLVGYDRNAIYSNRTYATEVVSSESEEETPIVEPADVSIEILNETPSVPPIQLNTTTIPNLSALAGMAGIIQRNLHHQLGDWNKKDDLKRAKDKHVRSREEREKRKHEEGRRRKNKKPSRFIRTREDMERNFPHLLEDRVNPASSGSMGSGSRESPLEVPAFASHSNSPIDLSVSRDIEDPGPSTSRGFSGGPTRLVIPDSDSDGEVQPLVIHQRENRNKSVEEEDLRKSTDMSKKDGTSEGRQENSSRDKRSHKGEKSKHSGSKKDSDDESEIEPTDNVLNNKEDTVIKDTNSTVDQWIEQSMQLQASDQAYLDPSTGLVEFIDAKASPVADTWELNEAVSWEEMDELEVVDVVRTNSRKERAEPEVVELIDDSDTDSGHINVDGYIPLDDHAGYTHSSVPMQQQRTENGGVVLNDEPINISSDEESVAPENEYSTIQDYIVDHPLPAGLPLRMSLYQPTTSRWDDDSSSDYDQFSSRGRDKKKGKGKGKSTGKPRPKSSSDDDDLIVVKTEYNTIDPITKKEIVDPVRNKKCNHIYERETILQNIDVAKQNGKVVKCPYMGCNCRDFKKSDLVKDKEVLNHIVKVKQEKEVEAAKKKEIEKKNQEKRIEEKEKRKADRAERKKKRKEEGRESSVESDGSVRSSDSIICEVIDMLKEKAKAKESTLEEEGEEGGNNEEVVQEQTEAASKAPKKTVEHKDSSSEKQRRRSKSKEKKKKKDRRRSSDKEPNSQTGPEIIAVRKKSYVVRLDPESRKSFLNESTDEEDEDLSKRRKKASKRKGKEKQRPNILIKKKTQAEKNVKQSKNSIVTSDNTDEEPKNTKKKKTDKSEVEDDKNVSDDVLPERTKRKRRRPAFLDDSYSTDDEALAMLSEGQKRKKHKKQKSTSPTQEHTPIKKLQKKVKIVGKKVTETWVRVEETEDPDPTPTNHENVSRKNRASTNEAKKSGKKTIEKLKKRKAPEENEPQGNEAEVNSESLKEPEKSKSEIELQTTSGEPKKSKKKIVQAQEINEEISKNYNKEKRPKHRKASKVKASKANKAASAKVFNDVENEGQENDDGKNISRRGTKPVSYEEPGSDFDD